MAAIVHQQRSDNGIHMYLGANPKTRDPNEDKYHASLILPSASTADLSQPRLLASYKGRDLRVPITDQKQMGACTAFSEIEIEGILANLNQQAWQWFSGGWVYEQERKKEGTWPQDAGASISDGLDIAMARGLPYESQDPYVADPARDFPDGTLNPSFVGSHHPFFVRDGNVLENIWLALDQGLPIALAMSWLEGFFSPVGGWLPGQTPMVVAGGHEIVINGCIPPANGKNGGIIAPNHWTPGWSVDAPNAGFFLRPGDFIIPWSYFSNPNIIWEMRVVQPKAVSPTPQPDPEQAFWAYWQQASTEAATNRDVSTLVKEQFWLGQWLPYLRQKHNV